jgi:hypothetical protein
MVVECARAVVFANYGSRMKKTVITISIPDFGAVLPALWICLGIAFALWPSFLWIVRDRSVWPWDQAWYGQVSTDLWNWLGQSSHNWVMSMADGVDIKPPGLVWLGQFFVGLRGLLGSVESSLLLSILLIQVVLLYILFKTGQAMFPGSSLVPAIGVLFASGTQLLVGLSHQFFVEPLQAVAVAWAFYVAERSSEWPKPRVLVHLGSVLVLGALAKATTPVYVLLPVAYAVLQVLRRPATHDSAELKVGFSRALALAFGILGVMCALWYLRHFSDVWRHVHDSTTGDVALQYGSRDTIFNKLVVWTRLLRPSFLAPYLTWAFAAALILGPVRATLQRGPLAGRWFSKVRPIAVLSILQMALLLVTFSTTIAVDTRYMYALLPCLTVVFMQVCVFVPRKGLMALALIALAQWITVHAASLSPDVRIADRSEWLWPCEPDPSRYDDVVRAVRLTSAGPEHNNVVAIEAHWLNANSLEFFAAKERLATGRRAVFVSPGYAQKDPVAAYRRIDDYHAWYVVTLADAFQEAPPNFLNLTSLPVLQRIRSESRFTQVPFPSRNGLIVFKVGPGPVDMAAVRDSAIVPAAIAQSEIVKRGKSALDYLNGSLRAGDGSFIVATNGIISCDGWAFDDVRNSTPDDVWIEFTQVENGHHYYWHARRYSRPALGASLKIPSVVNSGFNCKEVYYSVPAGAYSAQVYQIEGNSAIVSDFSTFTPSPRIMVK